MTERLIPMLFLMLSALQAVVFSIVGGPYVRAVGVVCLCLSVALSVARLTANRRLIGLACVGALVVVNFGIHLANATSPLTYRLAQLSVIAGYGAMGLAGLSRWLLRMDTARALLAAFSFALAILLGEAVFDVVRPRPEVAAVVWTGGGAGQPHPVLGQYDVPNSVAQTIYPDNPRGYFHVDGPIRWFLDIHDEGSAATLEISNERMRISISRATNPTVYNIQLRKPSLALRAREAYQLTFRIRADQPRPVSFGLSMAHAPWQGLGFYRELRADSSWQEFSEEFVLPNGDRNAQIQFDLGANSASVEVDTVRLSQVRTGAPVEPSESAPKYSVTYRFNALGCRGRDYPIPRRTEQRRILALGDSYTLGVGVHEEDTFTSRLERALNTGRANEREDGYEVINCGVSGYATREERLFYEMIGAQYEPDIVVLVMVYNDDMSWVEEVRRGFIPGPGGSLFHAAPAFLSGRHSAEHTFDYSESMEHLRELAKACEARHARLAVVIFDNNPTVPQWMTLRSVVASTLTGTGVPLLTLGSSLFRAHSPEELFVHRIDGHPNEIAHGIAAEEIGRFLKSNGLIE